jgi:hypothetical protein
MRLQVEVRREDEEPLRLLAFQNHRSVREQLEFLHHRGIQEEVARLKLEPEAVAEVA